MGSEPDFSGYATRADVKCTDGRTIMPNAFEHQDTLRVPLVWMHDHDEPANVLGHAILENRADGVYAYGYLNDSPAGQTSRTLVQHGDISSLSIYANRLVEKSKQVYHGQIQEVSLVLSGANPGARIDNIRLQHGDGETVLVDDAAIIYTGLPLELAHADSTEEKTVQDVYDSFTDEEKEVVHFMIGAAVEAVAETPLKQSDTDEEEEPDEEEEESEKDPDAPTDDEDADTNVEHSGTNKPEGSLTHQEGSNMSNVFDQTNNDGKSGRQVLSHDQLKTIVDNARKPGSTLKDAVLAHADEYGITDINLLFPDAKALTTTPEWISRRMEWVDKVLGGTKHSPFAKVKTLHADITELEARAKGYIKGNRKKEEVFTLLRRTTGPATIYKKQKLDRDDILDITDMDVINWLKMEMRLMIEEEIARAILVGDGRSAMDEDKVKDPAGANDGTGIRSILHDDDLYSIKTQLAANVSPKDAVKGLVRARSKYRGSGKPTLFVSDAYLTDIMLEEDKFGRSLYETEQALADKLRVKEIVTVDLFDDHPDLFAIMVSLQDYTVGSNRGGELTSFEDFDIDFNQHKYLQETRLSGGLTKAFSAVVVTRAQGVLAVAVQPSYDGATNTITIPEVEGVVYTINDEPVSGDVVITETTEVEAKPEAGRYLAANSTRAWTYSV